MTTRHQYISRLTPHIIAGYASTKQFIERLPNEYFKKNILARSMARSKTTTKQPKKPTRNARRRKKARVMRAVMPYSIIRKLKTCGYTDLNAGSGTPPPISAHQFYLNSAFDPQGTASATAQGLGYDQYEALYKRYCVVGYKVTFEAVSTDNTNPIIVGFTPTPDSTALTTYNHYKELPGTVAKIMTPDIDKVYINAKGSVKRWMLPRGGKIYSDDLHSALFSTNPTKILYGHLWCSSTQNGTDPASVNIVYTIEQIVMFYDPKIPSRSTQ